jgi:hypothetical protein
MLVNALPAFKAIPFSQGLYHNALLSLENSNQPNMKPQSLFNADLACSAKLDEPMVITISSQLSLYLLSLWFERSAITGSARQATFVRLRFSDRSGSRL